MKDLLLRACLVVRTNSNPGARFSKVPRTFRARKAIRKTTTCLFYKAGLLICCKGNKNKNNCKVSCLETPSFWRYKENYVTRNTPEKFRDFRATGPCSGSVAVEFASVVQHLTSPRFICCILKWRFRCSSRRRVVANVDDLKFRAV